MLQKIGVLDDELNVVTCGADSQDNEPFLDLDASTQLQELMVKALPSEDICSINEYISGEGSLSVCLGMDDTIDTLDYVPGIGNGCIFAR